jgi:hydrogenase maturation protease
MRDSLASILVIGIGNEFRSDDGVGLFVARAIEARALPGVTVIEQSGEGAALLDVWREAGAVYLVDAVASGAPAGTVYRIDTRTEPLPKDLHTFSTHAFGVTQAVELGRRLNTLPAALIIFGIEGRSFEAGKDLSSEVLDSMRKVTQELLDEIS